MTPTEALGAACWEARRWLGSPALAAGEPADLLCFSRGSRSGPQVLSRPDLVVLRGWSSSRTGRIPSRTGPGLIPQIVVAVHLHHHDAMPVALRHADVGFLWRGWCSRSCRRCSPDSWAAADRG